VHMTFGRQRPRTATMPDLPLPVGSFRSAASLRCGLSGK
jgi:hypothetical protein